MAKVSWGANGDPARGARRAADAKLAALRYGATLALEKSVEEGGVMLQDNLEAAVTRTGLAREQISGGFPGRHDSGNMVGSIGYDDASTVSTRARRVVMSFGWFAGEFEQYFKDQDLGEGNIPAARALPAAFAAAREKFKARLQRLVRGGEVD